MCTTYLGAHSALAYRLGVGSPLRGKGARNMSLDPWGFALQSSQAGSAEWKVHHDAVAHVIFKDVCRTVGSFRFRTEVHGLFTDLLPPHPISS